MAISLHTLPIPLSKTPNPASPGQTLEMHLSASISSRSAPSFRQLPHLSSTSSFSRTSPEFRRPILLTRSQQKRADPIRCSISKVHNYGTVDYERRPMPKWSSLYRRISLIQEPGPGAAVVLEQWEGEYKKLSKWVLCRVVKELRKFRRFKLALEVYDWMIKQEERFTFYSSDAAIRLDLTSKVHGILIAEDYFSKLPENFKDLRTYGSLLNAYAHAKKKDKAEVLFEKIKKEGHISDALPFNVMMTLYMNIGEHEKVNAIIVEMRDKNITFDIYSYNIWITTCAAMGNIEEIGQVLELMKSDKGINPNWTTYCTIATMQIRLGNFEKAEKYLKDAESRLTGRERTSFNYLIGLYSLIGKKEEVYRIWSWYKSTFPNILNMGYHSMLSALLKLGDIDGAESIFEEWAPATSSNDPRIWNILMAWYAREGQITKAERHLEHMLELGVKPNPSTWEILADGHIGERQITKALSCMKEATLVERPKIWRPRLATVTNFLALCKDQKDTASVETLIDILRKARCLDNDEYKMLISSYAGAQEL